MRDEIEHYWHELVCVMQEMPFDTLVSAAELLLDCYRRGSTVFILGSGNSPNILQAALAAFPNMRAETAVVEFNP